MPTYNVTASASSPPTNVGLKIDGHRLNFSRDDTGAWAASGSVPSSKNPVPFEFRATGVAGFKVTLKIALKAAGGDASGSFNKDYTIPDNLLLVVDDSIKVS